MDGLLALLIIFGLVRKLFGVKKGKTRRNRRSSLDDRAEQRIQQLRRVHEQLVKQQEEQKQSEQLSCESIQPEEGKALPCFEGAGHTGSLHVESTEGVDLCDPSLEHDRDMTEDTQTVYAGEIGREPVLDLSARGIYQGVVMSEILTRPAMRRARR